jgi:dienelactone hydrolase
MPVALALAAIALQVGVPAPTGQYPVGTTTIAVGTTPVQLWSPAASGGPAVTYLPAAVARTAAAELGVPPARLETATVRARAGAPVRARSGGWPIVVFSPGYGESRQLYTGLVSDLASRGYVVAALDHPGQATAIVYPGGRSVVLRQLPRVLGRFQTLVRQRVAAISVVLDRLRGLPAFAGALDLARIGVLGHSLGGAAAAAALVANERIAAAVDLDGSIGDLPPGRNWNKPFMLLESPGSLTASGSCGGGHCRHDILEFMRHLTGPRLVFSFRGAKHYNFSDYDFLAPELGVHSRRVPLGTIDPLRALTAERAYIAAFFDRYLKHRRGGLLDRPAYAEVTPVAVP